MKCPACDGPLTEFTVGEVVVDICQTRCGGVWFDAGELELFDEAHEAAPETLLRAISNQTVAVDRNRNRICPRCPGDAPLVKQFFDPEHELQLDQCASCSGVWADLGEIKTLRNNNAGAANRQAIISDFYARSTKPDTSEKAKRSMDSVLRLLFR